MPKIPSSEPCEPVNGNSVSRTSSSIELVVLSGAVIVVPNTSSVVVVDGSVDVEVPG